MGFYRHDQRGFACLADEVRGLQRRGQAPVPVPPLLDKQQTRKQYKYNAQSHDSVVHDVKVLVCSRFNLPHVN